MSQADPILLETKRFTVVRKSYQSREGRRHTHETIEHPGAVTIIPLLPDDHVCLVKNYRVAVGETMIELPAGTLEPNEDPRDAALRELAEETGYRAENITSLVQFAMSPGILNERMHLFAATELNAGEQNLDEGELIETLVVTWSQALAMIERAEIRDAKTIVGLLYYDRFRRKQR